MFLILHSCCGLTLSLCVDASCEIKSFSSSLSSCSESRQACCLFFWYFALINRPGSLPCGGRECGWSHFSWASFLKGQTSKSPNDNYRTRMFTAFQRRDWVYYLQSWSCWVMSPLSWWSQIFHCCFADLFMRKCHIVCGTHKSFHVKIKTWIYLNRCL